MHRISLTISLPTGQTDKILVDLDAVTLIKSHFANKTELWIGERSHLVNEGISHFNDLIFRKDAEKLMGSTALQMPKIVGDIPSEKSITKPTTVTTLKDPIKKPVPRAKPSGVITKAGSTTAILG